MAFLFGPYTPMTGTLLEIDIPQDTAVAEVQNRSPYDLWASFAPQAPVTGRPIATGFYGQLVRASSSKRLKAPVADPNTSNLGKLWLYPFNPFNPTGSGTAGASTIYAVTSADPDELQADSGIAAQNALYVPAAGTQAYVPAAGIWPGTDSQGNPFAYAATGPNFVPAVQFTNGGGNIAAGSSGTQTFTIAAPGPGQRLYLLGATIRAVPVAAPTAQNVVFLSGAPGLSMIPQLYFSYSATAPGADDFFPAQGIPASAANSAISLQFQVLVATTFLSSTNVRFWAMIVPE